MTGGPTFTRRALNRATLARQMLLWREAVGPLAALERTVGLQAQLARPPFVGLWSRVEPFGRRDLARLFASREVVRATTMRGTLHAVTSRDYLAFRGAIQPALDRGLASVLRERAVGLDIGALVSEARAFFAEKPRGFDAVREHLSTRHPGRDIRPMAYAVRLNLPLVQVPDASPWAFPARADFALAESWLAGKVSTESDPRALALRYLAAFGPATVRDMQVWSGLANLEPTFAALMPRLTVLRGERGTVLYDLPDAPRPPEDSPAAPRFVPEFDNLLLAHADRTRVIAKEHRPSIFLPGLRVAASFLVDGFVAGTWKVERARAGAALVIEPFATLPKTAREELAEEGRRLLAFLEEGADKLAVRFVKTRTRT
jgi:Winged helix DNA-binding domain